MHFIPVYFLISFFLIHCSCSLRISNEEARVLRSTCGRPKTNFRRFKIYGGKPADQGEYPWAVGLRIAYEDGNLGDNIGEWCTGVLISRRHILTAAHCYHEANATTIAMGICGTDWTYHQSWRNWFPPLTYVVNEIDLKTRNQQHLYKHQKIQIHPRWQRGNCQGGGDIAIIELNRDVPISVGTPICLPDSPDLEVYGQLTAIGWGKIPEKNMAASQYLQEVRLDIKAGYEKRQNRANNDQLRTEEPFHRNVCMGDSGGPLMDYRFGNNGLTTVLIGIVQRGTSCAAMYNNYMAGHWRNYPGGFWTDVRNYLKWICDVTNVGNCDNDYY